MSTFNLDNDFMQNPEHGCYSSAPAEVTIEDKLRHSELDNIRLRRKVDDLEFRLQFVMDILALLKSK